MATIRSKACRNILTQSFLTHWIFFLGAVELYSIICCKYRSSVNITFEFSRSELNKPGDQSTVEFDTITTCYQKRCSRRGWTGPRKKQSNQIHKKKLAILLTRLLLKTSYPSQNQDNSRKKQVKHIKNDTCFHEKNITKKLELMKKNCREKKTKWKAELKRDRSGMQEKMENRETTLKS